MGKRFLVILVVLIPVLCYSVDSVRVIFNYGDMGSPQSIVIGGKVKGDRWLGTSFYPATFKDATNEGYHKTREIKKGNFKEECIMDASLLNYYGSSYEIALWKKKVVKNGCKIHDCYWCERRGYHFEGLIFYQTGYFNTLWREK